MEWPDKVRLGSLPPFVDWGTGAPIVALHGGLSTSMDTYRLLGPQLAGLHRLIAPDLAGHYDSDTDVATLTHDLMADEVESVLDHLGLAEGPLHLLGFSLGSAVAMLLALRHPDRLTSLTLAAANTVPTARTRLGAAQVHPKAILAERPNLAASLERLHGTRWLPLAERLSELWHSGPLIAPTQLETIRSVLLIVGDRDPWIEFDQQQAVLEVCPDSNMLVIPDADHFVFARPHSVEHAAAAIRTHVERLEQCSAQPSSGVGARGL